MDDRARYRAGFLLVTGSAIAWSTAGLFTRLITVDVATMLFWRGVFGALGLGVLSLFIAGAKRLPPVDTALIGALDAPLAPVWVWLVFAETPAMATLIGGGIVFAAVLAHIAAAARE